MTSTLMNLTSWLANNVMLVQYQCLNLAILENNLNTRTSREEQCINSTRPVFETFHKTGIGTLFIDEDGKYE